MSGSQAGIIAVLQEAGACEGSFALLPRRVPDLNCFMKQDRIEEGKISYQTRGVGTADEDMVMERARELALINGRSRDKVLQSDVEQARKELTESGETEIDTPPEGIEPQLENQEAVPGSTGRQIETVPAPDEETMNEKLVDEGLAAAEHERRVVDAEDSLKRES